MVQTIFILLFLILFPFGQIIRIGIIHPIDVVVGLGALYSVFNKVKRPAVFVYIQNFLMVATFSWLFSIFVFPQITVLYGSLYLLRLFAYSYFLIYVWNFASNSKNGELLLNSLLSVSVISAVFGWFQFFMIPDLKSFFEWGWDRHLFRLVGTFLDPTFLGLIIVFGIIISMYQYIEANKIKYILYMIFLIASLAFTYSRASYLAFIAGIGYMFYAKRNSIYVKKDLPAGRQGIGYILYPMIVLAGLIFFLPTSRNHSISFFRSFSAIARLENYSDTIKVFKTSPLLGVGFNNICLVRQNVIGPEPFSSHACSGSDSSLLLILATTGVIGFIVFVHTISKINSRVSPGPNTLALRSSAIALFVHSIFSNSLFYPWVMGYIIILLSISLKDGDHEEKV